MGCAADVTGKILGQVEKGPSNYHIIGVSNLRQLLLVRLMNWLFAVI